jgi:hypothetical protein
MITYLAWYVEMWLFFTIFVLVLMTGLFWWEVHKGRYDPTLWDVEGDDEDGRVEDHFHPPPRRKKSVYDLIREE